jgi:hypothetical protein
MQFEYDVKFVGNARALQKLVAEINGGSENWEIVAVTQRTAMYTVVLRRQKKR